jgi:hypothetical protein
MGSDSAPVNLVDSTPLSAYLPSDRYTTLQSLSTLEEVVFQAIPITNEGLRAVVSANTRLEWLFVHACHFLSDAAFVPPLPSLSSLRSLVVAHCAAITDVGLLSCFEVSMPDLFCLNLRGAYHITPPFVSALLAGAPAVSQIHFVMCDVEPAALLQLVGAARTIVTLEARKVKGAIGNEILNSLARHTTLLSLQLSFERSQCEVTYDAILQLAKSCTQMHTLNLEGVRCVRSEDIEKFTANYPLISANIDRFEGTVRL